MTRFGTLLRRHRLGAGLSQNALARAVGCDPGHVNKIEQHQRGASRATVRAFATVLGLSDAERDRLLYAAGHAPEHDYQAMYDALYAALHQRRAS